MERRDLLTQNTNHEVVIFLTFGSVFANSPVRQSFKARGQRECAGCRKSPPAGIGGRIWGTRNHIRNRLGRRRRGETAGQTARPGYLRRRCDSGAGRLIEMTDIQQLKDTSNDNGKPNVQPRRDDP